MPLDNHISRKIISVTDGSKTSLVRYNNCEMIKMQKYL